MLPNYHNLLTAVTLVLVQFIHSMNGSNNGSCTTLTSTASTSVRCKLHNGYLPNCINPVKGTIATLTCNQWYEESALEKNPTRVCKDSGWDRPIYECHQMCGLKSPKAVTNIIRGQNVMAYGDYPWQISVYKSKDKEFICGGSILESRAILSAAHCFADYYGKALPFDDYVIAAGKYYRNYDDKRDELVQYSQILDILIPDRYKAGTHFFEADIAIIILKDPFEFSTVVLPVCINLGEKVQQLFNNTAIVTGWGITEEGGSVSEKLNELIVPIVPYDTCFHEAQDNFRRYITYDKICAGYKDKETSVCQGDSGGALVQKNIVDQLYYVVGIVSTSPQSMINIGSCDSNEYGAYTSVEKHIEFISEALAHYPSQEFVECTGTHCSYGNIENKIICNQFNNFCKTPRVNCILPRFPPNGKYSVISETITYEYIPGGEVPEASELFLTCDPTFTSDTERLNISICTEKGAWEPHPPKCARICPSLISSVSTNFKCEYNGKLLKNCENPKEGTNALLSCNMFYEEPSLLINPTRLCEEGKWNVAIPECYPICGDQTEMVKSWHVGIYKDQKFVCGGSIITPKIILSAAQCFTDSDSVRQPAEDYTVAAGKFLLKYYDRYQEIGAQYSTVLQIHIPEAYAGREHYHKMDIAILILREPFLLSKFVQPVCVDWNKLSLNSHTSLYNNGTGEIIGWGYTKKTRIFSDVLQEFKVAYRSASKCYKSVPSSLKKFVITDKICGEHSIENDETSVCGGDTGGGLVFYNRDDKRYYIKGIVSVPSSPDLHPCDIYPYSIYTSVDVYKNYLQKVIGNKVRTSRVAHKIRTTGRNKLRASKRNSKNLFPR